MKKLKGDGYTTGFEACNCRATNKHMGRANIAYPINWFFHPAIGDFFKEKGVLTEEGVKQQEEFFALTNMLQFVFRSRIRNGESINLYLPSERMRKILHNWLDGKIV